MIGRHRITVLVEGYEIGGWTTYSITTDLLTPSDGFSLSRPFDRQAWDLCAVDREVQVLIDGTPIVTGYIDDRDLPPDSDSFTISGRDKVGRLVQTSAPAFTFSGLAPHELIGQLSTPYFTTVSGSNDRNRAVVRGTKGKLARAGQVVIKTKKATGARIEPGQMRWAAIEQILRQTGELAMSSADGKELIVFRPNATQEPQYHLVRAKPGSRRGNCTLGERWSCGDRYSRIDVVGSGSGNANHYGTSVSSRFGTAWDNPGVEDGTGRDFLRSKNLLMLESVRGLDEAREFAQREMARRMINRLRFTATAPLHGQQLAGARDVTLFAPDTIAIVENELTGYVGRALVIGCTYTTNRQGGEETRLDLVPAETELFL